MILQQREIERKTWAQQHRKSSRKFVCLCVLDDGERPDIGAFPLPEVAYWIAMVDRFTKKQKLEDASLKDFVIWNQNLIKKQEIPCEKDL